MFNIILTNKFTKIWVYFCDKLYDHVVPSFTESHQVLYCIVPLMTWRYEVLYCIVPSCVLLRQVLYCTLPFSEAGRRPCLNQTSCKGNLFYGFNCPTGEIFTCGDTLFSVVTYYSMWWQIRIFLDTLFCMVIH